MRLDDMVTLGGGILPFDTGLGEATVRDIRAAANIGDRPLAAGDLPDLAPHISNVWLKMTLKEAEGEDRDEAGDEGADRVEPG